jgi:amino acid adenylation domain-containing protein
VGGEELTYRELDARGNRLARHLAGVGVGPESRVGVLLERGAEMVVAVLAVLKAGGACVPVDTSYPAERMALMLADAGARVLLSRSGLARPVDGSGLATILLDEAAGALASASSGPLASGATGDNLAYVFYTSGSTGRPKGVMMGHREIVQLAACMPDTMPIGPGDRVAQASNASFDAAVFEIWGALVNGAALVGIDREVLLSAPALAEALRRERVTHLYQTAALFGQHVRERVDVYAPLKQLVFGAEAVDVESVRRMLRDGRPGRVLHEYGPTEATVWCTLHPVEAVADDAATVSIGRPVPNARAFVLDPSLEPSPVGVPGELYVGGAGVVRGYLGRPSLTAERFVPDPFSPGPGARMYRTGDRVRWKADATLEFMGRLDEQVKIRGFRIEPGEIESALSALPGVREARVVVRHDAGAKRLVAYVAGEADADALRAHLRGRMPEYMVPAAFVVLDRLPLTPNGKLDRAALPAPELAAGEERYAPPRTTVEELLAGIWAELLRVERVGVSDGFFELGGHSLLAMRVVSRVREVFGVELPLRALFEGPTVAEVAARVEALRSGEAPADAPIVPVERTGPLPLSFGQERLWFIDRLRPGNASYNSAAALRQGGALDAPALERALAEVVRRHEVLRTTFPEVEGAPVQVVAPFTGFTLPVEDLSGLDPAEREAVASRRAGEEASRPFDLAAGPLVRATLLRLGPEGHVLLLCTHHVVTDGWSMGVLFRELGVLYEAYRDGRESPLAELPVQYADYAVWERARLDGRALERELEYWKARLGGAPALLELPTDRPRPAVASRSGASEGVELPAGLAEALQALARREGSTLYMVLLAGWKALLARYSGQDDVVVGTTIANRTRREVEALIGLFMNVLALRTDLSGDPSFRELLARVRRTALGAYDHQGAPFEKVVEAVRPERTLSHEPVFQVLFELNNAAPSGGAHLPAPSLQSVGAQVNAARYDLTFTLFEHGGGIGGRLQYATDLFDRETAVRLLEHYRALLASAAADPDRRLSALGLLGEGERALVVDEWNRTAREYPHVCIHELFEAQVRQSPDAVAVVFGGETLTYAELDARANRLAHHLRGRGVGTEDRVALCMERGFDLMAAFFGVLKAGAAYVPLDPAHPAGRLGWMLADSGARLLLTQSALAGRFPEGGPEAIFVDTLGDALSREPAERPESGVRPENLAYVYYTSGSTGRPKGVAMHHYGPANYFAWGREAYGAGQGRGAPVFSSMAVDLTLANFIPLFAGERVVLLPESQGVEALAEAIRGAAKRRPRRGGGRSASA